MKKKFSDFNELEKIRASISIHRNPDILVWNYEGKIDVKSLNNDRLDEYNLKLNDITYFYDKVIKYNIYFSVFYPNIKEITNTEALMHHVHSYLQDITILRNKLNSFIGLLKNNYLKISLNKKEDSDIFKSTIEKVENTFAKVVEDRNAHQHNGFRFLNSDIVDSEMCSVLLKDDFPLKNMVNTDVVGREESNYFEKAKNDYIKLAEDNSKQITGLINEVFAINRDYIYRILNIRALNEIMDVDV